MEEKSNDDTLNHQNKRNTKRDKKKNNRGFPYKTRRKKLEGGEKNV